MEMLKGLAAKWNDFYEKIKPGLNAVGRVWKKFWEIVDLILDWIVRLRKLLLAIPVALVAVKLAMKNAELLPDPVGINLLENGLYAQMVSRDVAVYGPLALTALCLLLMMCSRKTLYPWVISVFTLVLPLLVLLTNNFPA